MKPAHERVAARLTVTEAGCHEFQGAKFYKGYGNVRVLRDDGTWGNRGAHIVMWEHANGRRLADGKVIMHHCDNPPCCNPAHLSEATQAENLHDAAHKGRIDWADNARNRHQPTDPATGRFIPRHPAGH